MKISHLLTDDAILAELGQRLTRRRIERQLTQAELADQAGVSKRTVERLEAGGSTQLLNLLRIFRVLDLLPALDRVLPEPAPRPMELLKLKGKPRQRVSSARHAGGAAAEAWSWGDDDS